MKKGYRWLSFALALSMVVPSFTYAAEPQVETETMLESEQILEAESELESEQILEEESELETEEEKETAFEELETSYWYTDKDGNKHYVLDGEEVKQKVVLIDGNYYGFDENGEMYVGNFSIYDRVTGNSICYRAKDTGILYVNEWYQDGEYRYYYGEGGKAPSYEWYNVDGYEYFFELYGLLKVNDVENVFGAVYIFDDDGKWTYAKQGWSEFNGKRYYVEDDCMLNYTVRSVDGISYIFDADGFVVEDDEYGFWDNDEQKHIFYRAYADGTLYLNTWYTNPETGLKYYYDNTGKSYGGWRVVDGIRYYFNDSDGMLFTNQTLIIDGERYEFDANGYSEKANSGQEPGGTPVTPPEKQEIFVGMRNEVVFHAGENYYPFVVDEPGRYKVRVLLGPDGIMDPTLYYEFGAGEIGYVGNGTETVSVYLQEAGEYFIFVGYPEETEGIIELERAKPITGISVVSLPEKLEYIVCEEGQAQSVDYTGMEIEVFFEDHTEIISSTTKDSDGRTLTVDEHTINWNVPGEYKVKITLDGYETEISIFVVTEEDYLKGMETLYSGIIEDIKAEQSQLKFQFVPESDGMYCLKIYDQYGNVKLPQLSCGDITFSGDFVKDGQCAELKAGETYYFTASVPYDSDGDSYYEVLIEKVNYKSIEKLVIEKTPLKLNYKVNEANSLDVTGMKVRIEYANGTSETLSSRGLSWKLKDGRTLKIDSSAVNFKKAGKYTVKISAGNVSTSLDIQVHSEDAYFKSLQVLSSVPIEESKFDNGSFKKEYRFTPAETGLYRLNIHSNESNGSGDIYFIDYKTGEEIISTLEYTEFGESFYYADLVAGKDYIIRVRGYESDTYYISVDKIPAVKSIEVLTQPDVKVYPATVANYNQFDLTGLTAKVVYSDGSYDVLDISEYGKDGQMLRGEALPATHLVGKHSMKIYYGGNYEIYDTVTIEVVSDEDYSKGIETLNLEKDYSHTYESYGVKLYAFDISTAGDYIITIKTEKGRDLGYVHYYGNEITPFSQNQYGSRDGNASYCVRCEVGKNYIMVQNTQYTKESMTVKVEPAPKVEKLEIIETDFLKNYEYIDGMNWSSFIDLFYEQLQLKCIFTDGKEIILSNNELDQIRCNSSTEQYGDNFHFIFNVDDVSATYVVQMLTSNDLNRISESVVLNELVEVTATENEVNYIYKFKAPETGKYEILSTMFDAKHGSASVSVINSNGRCIKTRSNGNNLPITLDMEKNQTYYILLSPLSGLASFIVTDAKVQVEWKESTFAFTGAAQKPELNVMLNGQLMTEGKDYTLTYTDNMDVGIGKVRIDPVKEGTFTSFVQYFEIKPRNLGYTSVSIESKQMYTGKEICPKPVIKYGTYTLKEGIDYKLTYDDNINAGHAKVYVEGINNFLGNDIIWFEILPKEPLKAVENLKAKATGIDEVTLTWNTVVGAEGYQIYRKVDNGEFEFVKTVSQTSYVDTAATGNVYNYYLVYPYTTNLDGEVERGPSNGYVYAKPKTTPKAVENVQAAATDVNTVTVRWDASEGADGYIVYRKIGDGDFKYLYIVSETSYVDTAAKGNETNSYRIYPYVMISDQRYLGNSDEVVSAMPKAMPEAVQNLNGESTDVHKIVVTWEASEYAEGYQVYRKVEGGTYRLMTTTQAEKYIDVYASDRANYYYMVCPIIYLDSGSLRVGPSAETQAIKPKRLPDAVKGLKASMTNYCTITLKWSESEYADGYFVQRKVGSDVFKTIADITETGFVDKEAVGDVYNFYRIVPYVNVEGGMRKALPFEQHDYVYAKPKSIPVVIQQITAEATDLNEVTLHWEASEAVDGYKIYRKMMTGEFEYLAEVEESSYVDTQAVGNKENVYCVYPFRLNIDASITTWTSDKTVSIMAKGYPGAVEGLVAKATGIDEVTLTWNVVAGSEGYQIYRKVDNGEFEFIKTVSETSYIDTEATGNVYNYYLVYSYVTNKAGEIKKGPSNGYVYAKPKTTPKAVENVWAEATDVNTVMVSWNASEGADGYMICRKIDDGDFEEVSIVSETSYTDTAAKGNEINSYRIYPYVMIGNQRYLGSAEEVVSARPKAMPEAVQNLKGESTDVQKIIVTWEASEYAEAYQVYRKVEGGTYRLMTTTQSEKYIDGFASDRANYYYMVCPIIYLENGDLRVGSSAETQAIKSKQLPNVVKGLKASATNFCTVTLKWSESEYADGYFVQRKAGDDAFKTIANITETGYVDKEAIGDVYNFYRIVPYVSVEGGVCKALPLEEHGYVYAKPKSIPVVIQWITAEATDLNEVTLHWEASEAVDGYKIYRKMMTGEFEYVAEVEESSYVDTQAVGNEENIYCVYPYRINIDASITTWTSDKTVSAIPKAIPELVNGLAAKATDYDTVTVTWNKAEDVDGYLVQRKADTDTFENIADVTGASYVDCEAVGGIYNFYRVIPYVIGGDGNYRFKNPNKYVYAKPVKRPFAVNNLRAELSDLNTIVISWDSVEKADGYQIYRKAEDEHYEFLCDLTEAVYIDEHAVENAINIYRVYPYSKAEDGTICLGESIEEVEAKTKKIPNAVEGLEVKADGKQKVRITWNPVDDVDGYVIYRRIGKGDFLEWRVVDPYTAICYDDSASELEYNYYRVVPFVEINNKRYFGGNGDYAYDKGVLPKVNALRAVSGTGYVTVSWNPVPEADGYIIYRKKASEDKFTYRYMVSGTSFKDTTASKSEYNFYRVYPYYMKDGSRVLNQQSDYVYGKAK